MKFSVSFPSPPGPRTGGLPTEGPSLPTTYPGLRIGDPGLAVLDLPTDIQGKCFQTH